jgi:hypothetical protein
LEAVFPPASKKTGSSMDTTGKPRAFMTKYLELPSSFDEYAYKRLFINILEGLEKSHSGERVTGNIVSYSAKPRSFDTAEGRIKLQQDDPPHPFSEFDLVEKQDHVSLPTHGAIATVDLYYKPNRNDPNIGAILVTPANLFEIFPESVKQQLLEENKMRDQIFISYSHKDEELLDELLEHLRPLVRHGVISSPWSDKMIKIGEEWENAISDALKRAKLVILLVSPSFLNSDFIAEQELKPIYEASINKDLTIFTVHIRKSSYKVDKYLASLEHANKPEEPIARLKTVAERDEAWVDVAEKLAEAFNS